MTYRWITLDDGRSVYRRQTAPCANARSDLPRPMLIRDDMPETEHPCTGGIFTSKAAFRATTKAHGCIEVGNDPSRFKTLQRTGSDRKAIRESLQKAMARLNG